MFRPGLHSLTHENHPQAFPNGPFAFRGSWVGSCDIVSSARNTLVQTIGRVRIAEGLIFGYPDTILSFTRPTIPRFRPLVIERDLSYILRATGPVKNTLILVNRLPLEILSRTLKHRADVESLVKATHIRPYWRSTAPPAHLSGPTSGFNPVIT